MFENDISVFFLKENLLLGFSELNELVSVELFSMSVEGTVKKKLKPGKSELGIKKLHFC